MRLLFVFLSGCTCLQTVDELRDAGRDAGRADAGVDAGTTLGSCHCTGTRPAVNQCGAVGGLGWSCIDGQCLWECNGGRVCDVTRSADGGCITCGTPGTACRGQFCQNNTRTADVESTTCSVWPGTTIPFDRVTVSGGALCRYTAYQAAGVQMLGDFEELDTGEFLASFPGFGGTCTGTILATGLERWLFNCPDCQFVLRF